MINKLIKRLQNNPFGWDKWKERLKYEDELFKEFAKLDQKAEKQGNLVGSLFYEAVADGRAFYIVVEDKGPIVVVEHLNFGDGYSIEWIEDMGRIIPTRMALKRINQRRNLNKLFS